MDKVLNKISIIRASDLYNLELKVNKYINQLLSNGGLVIDVRINHEINKPQHYYAVITMQYNYNNGLYVNN